MIKKGKQDDVVYCFIVGDKRFEYIHDDEQSKSYARYLAKKEHSKQKYLKKKEYYKEKILKMEEEW